MGRRFHFGFTRRLAGTAGTPTFTECDHYEADRQRRSLCGCKHRPNSFHRSKLCFFLMVYQKETWRLVENWRSKLNIWTLSKAGKELEETDSNTHYKTLLHASKVSHRTIFKSNFFSTLEQLNVFLSAGHKVSMNWNKMNIIRHGARLSIRFVFKCLAAASSFKADICSSKSLTTCAFVKLYL